MRLAPAAMAASNALRSSDSISGIGGESTNTRSAPLNACPRVAGAARSPITGAAEGAILAALPSSLTSALTRRPAAANCLTSSEPTAPVAPTMRMDSVTGRESFFVILLLLWIVILRIVELYSDYYRRIARLALFCQDLYS